MAQKRQHRRNYNEPGHAHELTFSCYQGFKLLKEEIIRLSDEGFTLLRMSELKQQLEMRLPDAPYTYEELKVLVGLSANSISP